MIVILTCSQYSELIARQFVKLRFIQKSFRTTATVAAVESKGIILSGGPSSVYDDGAPHCDPEIWHWVSRSWACYGMQLMVKQLGGEVVQAKRGEYGKASLLIDDHDLLTNVEDGTTMWMSHGDSCTFASWV